MQQTPGSQQTITNGSVRIRSTYALAGVDGSITVSYTVNSEGSIQVQNDLTGIADTMPRIPRFGNTLVLKPGYDQVEWYGRGPHENYQDRNTVAQHNLLNEELVIAEELKAMLNTWLSGHVSTSLQANPDWNGEDPVVGKQRSGI